MDGWLGRRQRRHRSGQALVEFALAAPLFFMVFIGIIVLGIMVFYNQQLTNAAREAARFAAIHSASALCPVVGNLDPISAGPDKTMTDPVSGRDASFAAPLTYLRCDRPSDGWPDLTTLARSKVFGLDSSRVIFLPCWSGYWDFPATGNGHYDAPPDAPNQWQPCTIDGADPMQNASAIACQTGLTRVDTASSLSEGGGPRPANRVTVFACYQWSPPGAGFLLIPQSVTFRAVISEPIQRQQ